MFPRLYNKPMLLEGIFAPVTTPFYPDARIYFRKIEANMARYSRSLLAGMVVLGSTGEAVALDDAETRDVLRASIDATAPDKVLIAGVGRESVTRLPPSWPSSQPLSTTTPSSCARPVTMALKFRRRPSFTTSAALPTVRHSRLSFTTFPNLYPRKCHLN